MIFLQLSSLRTESSSIQGLYLSFITKYLRIHHGFYNTVGPFFSFFRILLQLIYKVVLISSTQKSDSVKHIHISIFFKFFTHIGYQRILSRFIQVCIDHPLHLQQCAYSNPRLPVYPSISPCSFDNHKFVFKACKSVSIL